MTSQRCIKGCDLISVAVGGEQNIKLFNNSLARYIKYHRGRQMENGVHTCRRESERRDCKKEKTGRKRSSNLVHIVVFYYYHYYYLKVL